jgi:hypothetical protein
VPLIDLDTGEVLDRALVGTLDLIERDAEGRIVVVDREAVRKKREAWYARVVRPLDRKRRSATRWRPRSRRDCGR